MLIGLKMRTVRLFRPLNKTVISSFHTSNAYTKLYTKGHCWIDFTSKQCGFSPYFFQDMFLSSVNCVVYDLKGNVSVGQPIGHVSFFCPEKNNVIKTLIESPVTGNVIEVNKDINWTQCWFYKLDQLQYIPDYMDEETYQSYLMALKT